MVINEAVTPPVTVTSNEQVAVVPSGCVAVYVTVVVPNGKLSPLVCEDERVLPQLAVGAVQVTTVEQPVAAIVMSAGQADSTNGGASTVTVALQVALLPAKSVAVKVTVTVPTSVQVKAV